MRDDERLSTDRRRGNGEPEDRGVILAGNEQGPFDDALRAVTHFWSVNDAELELTDDVILVDLQHEDLNLLVGCLTAAKYVQRETSAQIVGLIGHAALCSIISDGLYDVGRVELLARAFGVTTFLRFDAQGLYEFCEGRPDVVEMITAEMARFDAVVSVRDGLVDLESVASFTTTDGIAVGNYAADTAVRITRDPQMTDEGVGLLRLMVMDCLQIKAASEWVASNAPVIAYVTSHLVYTNWATAANVLTARGAVAILAGHEASGFQLDLVASPPAPGAPQYSVMAHGRAAVLDAIIGDASPERRALVRKVGALASSPDSLGQGWWTIDTATSFDRSSSSPLRRRARQRLGLPADSTAETVFVLGHCFSDAPRSEHGLFDDYWAWICWTLDRAMEITEKNWVLRFHPFSSIYGEQAVTPRLIERYGDADNIYFDNRLLSKDEFFSACDVAVTVRGTLGHELVRNGIPVIVAGDSAYSQAGFVYAPQTLAEYESLLRTSAAMLPALDDPVDRALGQTMLITVGASCQSAYVPRFAHHPWDRNLEHIARAYRSVMLEFDPGYMNFARAWRDGLPVAINGDLWALIDPSTPRLDRGRERAHLRSWLASELEGSPA